MLVKPKTSMDRRDAGTTTALMAVALSFAATAGAETQGLYFSVTGGQSSFDIPSNDVNANARASLIAGGVDDATVTGSSQDDTDIAFGLHVGYAFNPYVAFEIGYMDLGEAEQTTNAIVSIIPNMAPGVVQTRFSTTGATVGLVGSFPFGEGFEIYGRGGLFFSDNRIRLRLLDGNGNFVDAVGDKSSDTDLYAGVGVGWNISDSLELRLGYQRYLDVGEDLEFDIDMISVSFLFR